MAVTVEQFLNWAFKIRDTIVSGRGIEHTAWIAPVTFC